MSGRQHTFPYEISSLVNVKKFIGANNNFSLFQDTCCQGNCFSMCINIVQWSQFKLEMAIHSHMFIKKLPVPLNTREL